jgi:hypothetical protein
MTEQYKIGEEHSSEGELPRRGFIDRALNGVLGIALAVTGCSPGRSPTLPLRESRLLAAERETFLNALPRTPLGVPALSRMPDGFSFAGAMRSPASGFRSLTNEFAMYYRTSLRPRSYRSPSVVYVAEGDPIPLPGTIGPDPLTSIRISLSNGSAVDALYGSGAWRMPTADEEDLPQGAPIWELGRMHSLVFPYGSLAIGIRGVSSMGFGRTELLEMASALRFD